MLEQQSTTSSAQQAGPAPRSQQAPQPQAASHHAEAPVSLTQSADQALQSVTSLYSALDGVLQRQLQESPYVTLAAAAGVGFVLGGGMRSPIGQLLVRLSVRAFGPPLVNAALHGALERATGGSRDQTQTYAR